MTYKVSATCLYVELTTHDATEDDDDQMWCDQNAAHDMTGNQVIVVLRLKSTFLYLKENKRSLFNNCVEYYPG